MLLLLLRRRLAQRRQAGWLAAAVWLEALVLRERSLSRSGSHDGRRRRSFDTPRRTEREDEGLLPSMVGLSERPNVKSFRYNADMLACVT
jgi:hypothetical protein